MMNDISVYHSTDQALVPFYAPQGAWVLKTCLRTIVLVDATVNKTPSQLTGFEHYTNHKALSFLLEVVCGLHSPLIGETEILGQFKTFVKKHRSELSPNMSHFLELVLREAKRLRTEHLQNLGGTSYGSLLRKEFVDDKTPLTFIGAGSLVADIIPWCMKRPGPMAIYTRKPDKHEPLSSHAQLYSLDEFLTAQPGILILAAPVSSDWVYENVDFDKFSQIFDLRGESRQDPIERDKVVTLTNLFSCLENNQKKAAEVKRQVLCAIDNVVQHWQMQERPRPFGWEDLCAYS